MAHQLLQRQSLHYTLAADSIVKHLQHCSEIQVEAVIQASPLTKEREGKRITVEYPY